MVTGNAPGTGTAQPGDARALTVDDTSAGCVASWYGATDEQVEGHPTADGDIFHANLMTAASMTLPYGTIVKVTDTGTGKSVVVKINDTGHFSRCIDLSGGAFASLGRDLCQGLTNVRIDVQPTGTPTSPPDPNFRPISMSDCPPGSGTGAPPEPGNSPEPQPTTSPGQPDGTPPLPGDSTSPSPGMTIQ